VLAFDTSSPAVTVALASIGAAAGEASMRVSRTVVATNRQGERLTPLIESVLADADVAASDLEAIAVGLGPGPFTGLRVGIVTAKAMADALHIPAYGESSLRLVSLLPTGVVTNARRKQVYWAITAAAGFQAGPDLAAPAAAAEQFAANDVVTVCGEGASLYPDAFEDFDVLPDLYPRADVLALRVADRVRALAPSEPLRPMYLRRPDAVPPGAPKQVTPA
jgi:tRNA threonylcarbamoyladenosine biosynthesis protein TsaB